MFRCSLQRLQNGQNGFPLYWGDLFLHIQFGINYSMIEQDKNKRVVKNSIFLAGRMVVVTLISIFTTRFLLKNLGVEDFGIYNVTLGVVALCSFLTPAFSNAIQRYFNYELGKNGINGATKVFNSSIQIQVALVVLLVIICETAGLWYIREKLVVPDGRQEAALWIFHFSVIAFSFSLLQVPFVAAILAHEKMNFYAIVNIIDAVLKLIIAVGIAFASYDKLVIYGLLLLGINIFNFVIYGVYSYCHFKEMKFKFSYDKQLLKGLLSFSGWNLFDTVARIGKDLGGNLLLNFYFGPVLNAAKGVTNQVSYAFSSIIDSTVMASRPQMVMSYSKGDTQRSLSMFYSLSKGTLLLILMLSLPVYIDVEYILRIWIGTNIPDYTIDLIRLSIILLLIDKLASPVTALIHATGKVKRYHLLSGVINIMVVPVAWFFFEIGYNPSVLYVITIFGAFIAQITFLYVIKSLLPFSIIIYVKKVCLPFVIVFLMASWAPFIMESLINEGVVRLLLVSLTSIVMVSLISYFCALTNAERELINGFIHLKR